MTLKRMDNVGIVVESLDAAIPFFVELGLTLEGRATIEGEWAGRVTGLGNQRVEIAMLVTPDGHSRLELSRFLAPPVVADHRNAPVNALGYLRVMFTVDDIDDTLARLQKRAARRRGGSVRRGVSALLHPLSRGTSHRARRGAHVKGPFAPAHQTLVGTMRRSLRKRLPRAHEVAYEYSDCVVISYSPNERGYEGVLAIRASAKGVDLYFNRGKELPDPDKRLRGSAKLVRFVHIESASTLKHPAVARLIDEAIARARVPFATTGRAPVVIRSTSARKRRPA